MLHPAFKFRAIAVLFLPLSSATVAHAQYTGPVKVTCFDEKTREEVPCGGNSSSSTSSDGGPIYGLLRLLFSPPGHSSADPSRSAAHSLNEKGNAAYEKTDWDSARAYYEEALQKTPDDEVMQHNLGHAQNQLGVEAFKRRNLAEPLPALRLALSYFLNAVKNDPSNSIMANNLKDAEEQVRKAEKEARDAAVEAAKAQQLRADLGTLAVQLTSVQTDVNELDFDGTKTHPRVPNTPGSLADASTVDLRDMGDVPLIVHPEDLKTPAPRTRGEPITEASVPRDLATMRREVAGIQQALRHLAQSNAMQEAERREWEEATRAASQDAFDRGIQLGSDLLNDFTLNTFNKSLGKIQIEVSDAAVKLSGEMDPNRREQIGAAIKMMEKRKQWLKNAIDFVEETKKRGGDATAALNMGIWAKTNQDDLEKSLEGLQQVAELTLKDEKVQVALGISDVPAKFLKYADSIIKSSYDIAAESLSIQRINQLNGNSQDYLSAVNQLNGRMKKTLKEIHELEQGLSQVTPDTVQEKHR